MKKYTITILIAMFFIATPVEAKLNTVFSDIINLLIEVNIELRQEIKLLEIQIQNAQNQLSQCTAYINPNAEPILPENVHFEANTPPPAYSQYVQICPESGNCYQVPRDSQYRY